MKSEFNRTRTFLYCSFSSSATAVADAPQMSTAWWPRRKTDPCTSKCIILLVSGLRLTVDRVGFCYKKGVKKSEPFLPNPPVLDAASLREFLLCKRTPRAFDHTHTFPPPPR
jgi:hypothetical protein